MRTKKILLIGIMIGIPLMFPSCGNDHRDHMRDGMMENGRMGSGGMMGDRQGMMRDTLKSGQGALMGRGQSQSGSPAFQHDLSMDQARQLAAEYLQKTGSASLKIGAGSDQGEEFEFPLVRKSDGSRVASLLVKKSSGEVVSQR